MDLGSLLVRGGKDVPRSPRPPPGSPSSFRRAHHFRSASVGGFITPHAADGGVDNADYTLPPLSPQPPRRIPAAAALFSASADGGRHLQLPRDATPGIAPAAASVSPPRGPPASPLSAVAGRFAGNGGRGSAAAESQPRAQEGGEESEGEGESSAWEWESESESELEWEEFVVVARALGGHDARGITVNTSNAQQQQAPGSPISKQQQLLGTAPGRPRQRKIASSSSAEFPAAVLLRSSRRASVSPPPVSPMRSSPRHASAVFPRSWSAGAPDAADAPDAPPARLPRSTLSAHVSPPPHQRQQQQQRRSGQRPEMHTTASAVTTADAEAAACAPHQRAPPLDETVTWGPAGAGGGVRRGAGEGSAQLPVARTESLRSGGAFPGRLPENRMPGGSNQGARSNQSNFGNWTERGNQPIRGNQFPGGTVAAGAAGAAGASRHRRSHSDSYAFHTATFTKTPLPNSIHAFVAAADSHWLLIRGFHHHHHPFTLLLLVLPV
ncbi:unnamed protein product [Closterium sp. Naga37s-1]|nr:unnamed protein product [Closterium sp. Naga37s-1]